MAGVTTEEVDEDRRAPAALERRSRELTRKVFTARRNHLDKAIKRARRLKARIEAAEEHQDPDTLALWSEYDEVMDKVEETYEYIYSIIAAALLWRYSTADVKSWFDRALAMDCTRPPVGKQLIEDLLYVRRVPTAPFRDRVIALTALDGWSLPRGDARTKEIFGHERIDKLVGVVPHTQTGARRNSLRIFIQYEQGVELARLLEMSPQLAGV